MTMIERKAESIRKEILKLEKSLTRTESILSKKTAKAEKVGANWTRDEWFNVRDTATQAQAAAYFDMSCYQSEVEDIKRRLLNAHERLKKISPKVKVEIETREEQERLNRMDESFYQITHQPKEEREREFQEWLRRFKAECFKDGVIIEQANGFLISGRTKGGQPFGMELNSGYTERSRHCYTLWINRNLVFTSGDFSTGYGYLVR